METNNTKWKGYGTSLHDCATAQDAWNKLYPYTVHKLPVAAMFEHNGEIKYEPCTTFNAVFRSDGKELGKVGTDYQLVQPHEAFNDLEPLIKKGLITLRAGGELRDGRQIWALAEVVGSESEILPNDSVKCYINRYTGFDGGTSDGINNTGIRPICMNTLLASISDKSGAFRFIFKHTKNVRDKTAQAMLHIEKTLIEFQKTVEAYKHMAKKQLSRLEQEKLIAEVFLTPEQLAGEKELSSRKTTIVQDVIELLDTQKGLEAIPAMRGTAWQAYNAVTEYTTHHYGRNADTRLHAQWFGESKKLADKAFTLALNA